MKNMYKPNKKRIEQWVDIIHKWHKSDPYPPIRPLVEKIDQAIQEKEVKKVNKKRLTNPTKSPTVQRGEPRPEKTMDFGEAMRMIAKGRKIKKLEWGKNWFAFLYKEDATVALSDPDGEMHSWIISEGDIIGKDYIVI